MTRHEIAEWFPKGRKPDFGASAFACPTLGWLRGPFWAFFRSRYWAIDLDKWKFRWECRDFARAYACAAQECWASTKASGTADESDACAVGEIWFLPDSANPLLGHAICPVFTDHGLQFIEPQTGQLYPMSAAQIQSRYFLRF